MNPVTKEILDARVKLADLRLSMENIKQFAPFYSPGNVPTAADACRMIFDSIDDCLRMLEVYIG